MAPKHQDLALKLVAVSGAEKPIIMRLGQDRVELRMNIKSKALESFEYERLLKWTRAASRGGPAECLDIQVHTDKGPRDLRFKCSSADGVEKLSSILEEKLAQVMEKRKKSGKGFQNAANKVKNVSALKKMEQKQQTPQKPAEESTPVAAATVASPAPVESPSAQSNMQRIPAAIVNDAANTKLEVVLVVGPPGVAITKASSNQLLGRYKFNENLRKCMIDPKDSESMLIIVKDKKGKDQQLKIRPSEMTAPELLSAVNEFNPNADKTQQAPKAEAKSPAPPPPPPPPAPAPPPAAPPPPPPPPAAAPPPPAPVAPPPPAPAAPPPPPPAPPPSASPPPPRPPPAGAPPPPAPAAVAPQAAANPPARPPPPTPPPPSAGMTHMVQEAEARAREAEATKANFEHRSERAASRLMEVETTLREKEEEYGAKIKALEDANAEKTRDLAHAKKIMNELEMELAHARKDVEAVMQTTAGATFSTPAKTAGSEGENSEMRRMQAFIARMQEGLVERDGRMIRLERKYREEKSHRELLETKLRDSMAHNRRLVNEMEERERQLQTDFLSSNGIDRAHYHKHASASKLGAEGALALIPNADIGEDQLSSTILRRESIKLAKNECMRLEREREEMSTMNGKLTLRLGGMETTISRLRQSLKLEDAANALLANGAVN